MAIMTRILRLWKADIHGVMDQLEDKELLLKQYLREMENNLSQKESRLQKIADTSRQIQKEYEVRKLEIDKIEQDLLLALRKEKDDIAKLLIRKQRTQQIHCEQMQQQLATLEEEEKKLRECLEQQRLKYDTLKVKAATFHHKQKQTKLNETEIFFSEAGNAFTIDENEIELELMRRKENLREKGGVT